jgi:hypothetical protein
MLFLDGSMGEGGGQVLRTSLGVVDGDRAGLRRSSASAPAARSPG